MQADSDVAQRKTRFSLRCANAEGVCVGPSMGQTPASMLFLANCLR